MHKVIFAVLSFLFACLLLEIGLRFSKAELGDSTMIPVHWIMKDPDWTVDPDLIYAHRLVLAEIDRVATSSSTAPLILALGDSFTAGDPHPDEKSFPVQLQRSLSNDSIHTEVLNAGTSGYNPDQELILLNKILQKGIRPKVVVWSFYINDLYESGQWPNFTLDKNGELQQLDGANNFIYQRQKFFDSLPLPRVIKENSALVTAMLHFFNLKIDQEIPREFRDPDSNIAWVQQKLKLEIKAAHKLAQQYDFTLVFVAIDPQSAYYSQEFLKEHKVFDDSKEVEIIKQLLHQEKYYVHLNFNTLFETGEYSLQPPQCVDGSIKYFNPHGSEIDDFPLGQHHFNELGYALFGEVLKEMIQPLLVANELN